MQGQPQSSGEPWDLKHAGDPRGGGGGGGGRRGGGGAGAGGGGRGTHLTTSTCKNKTLARTTLKCYQSAAFNHSLKSKAAMSQSSWFVYQNSQKQVKSSGQSIKLLILLTFTLTFHLISESSLSLSTWSQNGKTRRRRTAFTSEQLMELEKEFHTKKYLRYCLRVDDAGAFNVFNGQFVF